MMQFDSMVRDHTWPLRLVNSASLLSVGGRDALQSIRSVPWVRVRIRVWVRMRGEGDARAARVGYDGRLTRGRCSVRSGVKVFFGLLLGVCSSVEQCASDYHLPHVR